MVERFERSYLAAKLREHGGNVSRTADAIGVSRQLVHRLIDRYDLRTGER
ncbi:helix-turn-helix domain-containing protein [Sorangium sp. So ce131]